MKCTGESEEVADWFVTVHFKDCTFKEVETIRFERPNQKKGDALSSARLEWLELYGSDTDADGKASWKYIEATAEKGASE